MILNLIQQSLSTESDTISISVIQIYKVTLVKIYKIKWKVNHGNSIPLGSVFQEACSKPQQNRFLDEGVLWSKELGNAEF